MNLVDVVPYLRYEEYGCNWMHQWRAVDHTVSYDYQVISRMAATTHKRWCPKKFSRPTWRPVPQPYINEGVGDSGQLAIELAQRHGAEHIWVIGCDWGVTDASVQDQCYEDFRGYQPPKFTDAKHKWLSQLDASLITWVHLEPQPWMASYINHTDFLELALSRSH